MILAADQPPVRAETGGGVELAHTRRVLPSGLTVLVHEDPSAVHTAVSMWYRVGSTDEEPGESGVAHLFEHLFKNSEHVPRHHYEVLRTVGVSSANASTSPDRTLYHEVVPPEALPTALWLESDRMGYLMPTFSAERLEGQRAVVRSERKQRYDNAPYGAERLATARAMYGDEHPYRHLTIGTDDDIAAITLPRLQRFYRTWYVPANAILAIAGPTPTAEVLAEVDRWFGSFPPSQRPARATSIPAARTGQRLAVGDRYATTRRLRLAWSGPAWGGSDACALDVVTATLSRGGTGQLWKRLVHDGRLARRINFGSSALRLFGEIHLVVDLLPDADAAAVRAIIDDELANASITSEDLARAVARRDAAEIWSLQAPLARAQRLQWYEAFAEDPGAGTAEAARYRALTVEACAQAMATWVRPALVTEVETVPGPHVTDADAVPSSRAARERRLAPRPT